MTFTMSEDTVHARSIGESCLGDSAERTGTVTEPSLLM